MDVFCHRFFPPCPPFQTLVGSLKLRSLLFLLFPLPPLQAITPLPSTLVPTPLTETCVFSAIPKSTLLDRRPSFFFRTATQTSPSSLLLLSGPPSQRAPFPFFLPILHHSFFPPFRSSTVFPPLLVSTSSGFAFSSCVTHCS